MELTGRLVPRPQDDCEVTAREWQGEGESRVERVSRLARCYRRNRQKVAWLNEIGTALADAPGGRISLTDPGARAMATSARTSGIVGCNVQNALDTKSHLISVHKITNQGFLRDQLSPMAVATKEAYWRDDLHTIAERGFFGGPEIPPCEEAGITCDAACDVCICQTGEELSCRSTRDEHGVRVRRVGADGCQRCRFTVGVPPAASAVSQGGRRNWSRRPSEGSLPIR